MAPQFFELQDVHTLQIEERKAYVEFLRVLRGRARMTVGKETRDIAVGSMIFVPAAMEHYFHDVQEELAVLVLFAPAETP